MIKDELIRAAREKGFVSRDRIDYPGEGYYYLWLCELADWLRNVHIMNPFVILMNNEDGTYSYESNIQYDKFTDEECNDWNEVNDDWIFPTYLEAYEDAIYDGLKEIGNAE